MNALLQLFLTVIDIYTYILVIAVVLSWLVAFDVINLRNRIVRTIYDTTNRLMDPALRPIRRILPNLGGLDISPLILFVLLVFIKNLLIEYWPRTV